MLTYAYGRIRLYVRTVAIPVGGGKNQVIDLEGRRTVGP